jgi:type I restriction enzyme S subunit
MTIEKKWRETTLGEVLTLQRGFDLPARDRRPGKVPIVTSAGISGTHAEARIKAPGVVTGRYGTVGQVYFIGEDFWPHNTTLYVKDFKGNDPLFSSYLLRTINFLSCSDKSGVPGVNRNHLHLIKVQIPEPSEQRAIASVLGALDDKIELNRRMNETLEAMARAFFKSWFIDFDPVRAKLNNKIPAGLSDAAAALFPADFQESIVGPIPRGWTVTNLGQEAEFLTGFAFKSETFSESSGIRLARGDNVKEGFFHWDAKSRYWPEITSDLERYRLKIGDVLIGMDGSKVGKNWVRVRRFDLPCLLVQRVARLRARASIGEHFIWLLISDPRFRFHVEAVKTGTSIPHISGSQIRAYDFIRPPVGDNRIFNEFEQLVAPMCEQMDANIEQSQTLAALRDALLPKLLSGELRLTFSQASLNDKH